MTMKRLFVGGVLAALAIVVLFGWPSPLCAQVASPSPKSDYKLNASDVIIVDVVGEKELEKLERRVSSTGTITFPYLEGKDIAVEGMTTADVGRKLRDLLISDEIFVNPQVVVQVKEYKKRTVTVVGQVTKQSVVEFPSEQEMNILEAIGYAGGFTDKANKNDITVTRKGKQYKFNLKEWSKKSEDGKEKSDLNRVFMLEPNDLIYVPESLL